MMTVAGTVDTFDAGSFKSNLATSIDVEPDAVTLNVTAASVRITATILLVENATGVIPLVQLLASNITALSLALNVAVDSVEPPGPVLYREGELTQARGPPAYAADTCRL